MEKYRYTVEYTLTDPSGNVIDSTQGREPFTFTTGQSEVIPGFEREVAEMEEGQEKTFTLQPSEAYGERREELVEKVPRQALQGLELYEGQVLQGTTPDGRAFLVRVVSFNESEVVLDHNHPLAGVPLTFKVKVLRKEEV
ncbi:FKBP-type peptidyl-prolyl cis-trans isomerase SlyD [Thermovibrio guaymasensis]|uniref:Peptidyl-prolyl cis-trans isomerase n=1 Tax=Thermovibrio guaymasensis TaxID=240167 RepID=A0A420W7P8_9BACT|nr:FKBP-type peptidyl-prolyl cis-trans isomerase [Thermovibrio guaymasensis]RKQ63336.1 FKBP-type peptidyl-prolyl cis-trans isomerase SlyD [Thermovibrio guaymasensis]